MCIIALTCSADARAVHAAGANPARASRGGEIDEKLKHAVSHYVCIV
jgi:hypothetical protein